MSEDNTPDSLDNVEETQETSWQSDAGLDGNASFEKFGSVSDLAKSYTELENYQAGSVRIPSDDASDEQMEKFLGRLDGIDGVMRTPDGYTAPPEAAEGYKFDEVEGFTGDGSVDELKAEALNLGMTQAQANGIHSWLAKNVVANDGNNVQANTDAFKELEAKWGQAYQQNLDGVDNTMSALSKEVPGISNIAKTADFAQLMEYVGRLLGESGTSRQDPRSLMTPADASMALMDVQNKIDEKGLSDGDSGYAVLAARKVELQKLGGRMNFARVDDY